MSFDRTSPLYIEDLLYITSYIPSDVYGKRFIVTGATGLLGTLIVDTLSFLNQTKNAGIKVFALGRNIQKITDHFAHWHSTIMSVHHYDALCDIPHINADYIINCAGNSHPALFAKDPVGTIMGNIRGAYNVLDLATKTNATCLLISSGEIYGNNTHSDKPMDEKYTGDLPLTDSRICYPEGKRAIEALAQSFIQQHGTKIKIVRPCRIFGPTMLASDNKASAQFIRKGKQHQNIILKSPGEQQFSYIYGADAVSAILHVLFKGDIGMPYNISNRTCDTKLRDFALAIAKQSNVEVSFDMVGEQGGSTVMNALLDNTMLTNLGWKASYNLYESINRTLNILL